jgi:biotin synthase
LSAGRAQMSDELQALCFMAGANSIFYGERLLTTGNPDTEHDLALFRRLKITAEAPPPAEISPMHPADSPERAAANPHAATTSPHTAASAPHTPGASVAM